MRQHRLTLHRRESPASDIEPSDEVATEVVEVWATLEPTGGSEAEQGDRRTEREGYTIRFRWGASIAGIDSTWWATWDNPMADKTYRFDFASVAVDGEAGRWVTVKAVRHG